MTFLSLRQEVGSWTLHEDDQVSPQPLSSSTRWRLYPKQSSNPKSRSMKKLPKPNTPFMRDRSNWASASIISFVFPSSNSQKTYPVLHSENWGESTRRGKASAGGSKKRGEIAIGPNERGFGYRNQESGDQVGRGRERQHFNGFSVVVLLLDESSRLQEYSSSASVRHQGVRCKALSEPLHRVRRQWNQWV